MITTIEKPIEKIRLEWGPLHGQTAIIVRGYRTYYAKIDNLFTEYVYQFDRIEDGTRVFMFQGVRNV